MNWPDCMREQRPCSPGLLQGALDYINDRYDCSDFVLRHHAHPVPAFSSTLLSKNQVQSGNKQFSISNIIQRSRA